MHPKPVLLPPHRKEASVLLFGTPRLSPDGGRQVQLLKWRSDIALLGVIACRTGWHSRETLAQLVRPDASASLAKSYLRGLLHRLRARLGSLSCLEIEPERVRWTGGCDVVDFDAAIDCANWQAAAALHSDLLASRAGSCGVPALDDWYFDERTRLHGSLQTALRNEILRLRFLLVDSSRQMLRLAGDDPDEVTVAFLLAHAQTPAERHLAATIYMRYTQLQAHESTTSTRQNLQAAYNKMQSTAAVLEDASQAPQAGPVPDNREAAALPASVGALWGREDELQAVQSLLASSEVRLINIHGLGGVGKSRLARELYALQATHLTKAGAEVLWIGVQDSHLDAEGLLSVLRRALKQPSSESDQDHDWLPYRLGDGPKLLFIDGLAVSDNSVQAVSRLLGVSPTLRLLVTARKPLGIAQEHRVTLRGLKHSGLDSPAAHLFMEQAARLGADVKRMSRAEVSQIAAYVEGIPLALELVASWTVLLSLRDIHVQLAGKSSALQTGLGATGGATMDTIVRSVWDTLAPSERIALTGLAVHYGPLTFDTALLIADTQPRVLLSLAHYALLQRGEDGGLRVPPLFCQIIATLAGSDVVGNARTRHARHYLGRLANGPEVRLGQTPPERVGAIRKYFDEVVVAWRWALDIQAFDLIAAATQNMLGFLFAESRFEIARELSACTVAALPVQHPLYPVYCAFQALGAIHLGRMPEAASATQRGMQSNPQGTALALLCLAASRLDRFYGRHQTALAHAEAAMDAAQHSDGFIRLRVREDCAVCQLTLGRTEDAMRELRVNLVCAQQLDAPFVQGRALMLLGSAHDTLGLHQQAIEHYEKALAVFSRLNDGYQMAYCHRIASHAYANLDNVELQRREAELALEGFRTGGHIHELSESLYALGMAQHRAGELGPAFASFKDALGASLRFDRTPSTLRCIWRLGLMLLPTHRVSALAAMQFAVHHPALRHIDKATMHQQLDQLAVTPKELPRDAALAHRASLEDICQMLISADCSLRPSPQGRPALHQAGLPALGS